MSFSKSARIFGISPETVPGTTDATPVFYELDTWDSSELNATNEVSADGKVRKSRAAGKKRKTQKAGDGNLDVTFTGSNACDYLLQSVLGAAWVEAGDSGEDGDILTAGITDFYFTAQMQEVNGSTKHYFTNPGSRATELTISVEAASNEAIKAAFKVDGFKPQVRSLTQIVGATYPPQEEYLPFIAEDVTVQIGATAIEFSSLEMTFSQPATKEWVLGQAGARGMSVGTRATGLSFKAYRLSTLALDTMADSDAGVEVLIKMVLDGVEREFFYPAAQFVQRTMNETQDETRVVALSLEASEDATAGTEVIITRKMP